MNYYLILGEELLLVSDEKPSFGKIYDNDVKSVLEYTQYDETTCYYEKLIAGTNELPKITFSEEAYKEMKERFGWVDIDTEAYDFATENGGTNNKPISWGYKCYIEGLRLGLSLNKNRFSEEDMVEFYEWCDTSEEAAIFWRKNRISPDMSGSHYQIIKEKRKELLQLWQQQRQPKRVKVDVEMEEVFFDGNEWKTKLPKRFIDSLVKTKTHPKISNNTIKITRICK